MATSTSTHAPRRKRWLGGAAIAALAVVSIAYVTSRRSSAPTTESPSPSAPAEKSSKVPIPSFERPEEAKRYFEAMIQGDTRAIEQLDRTLAKAREQKGVTPTHVEELERLRAERVERLEAHRSARPE